MGGPIPWAWALSLLLVVGAPARAETCRKGFRLVRDPGGGSFNWCCPPPGDARMCEIPTSGFGTFGAPTGGEDCFGGPCMGHGECYKDGKCCYEGSCTSVFDGQYKPKCSDSGDPAGCKAYVAANCRAQTTSSGMRSCVKSYAEGYPAYAAEKAKAAEDERRRKEEEERKAAETAAKAKAAEEAAKKRRAWAAAAKRKKAEEEARAAAEAKKEPPAEPAPDPAELARALETLFPGGAGRVERAVVEYLAKDKASREEVLKAATGPGLEAARAKWREAAVKKAGEHLLGSAADADFAAHLAAKGIGEDDLARYYCANRPLPKGGGAAMDQLHAAEAGGAAVVRHASAEGAKDGAVLAPSEVLAGKCAGQPAEKGETPRRELTESFALRMSSAPAYGSRLPISEVPGPGGGGAVAAGGDGGRDKAKAAGLGALGGAVMGAAAALIPGVGPIAVLIGAALGALFGLIFG